MHHFGDEGRTRQGGAGRKLDVHVEGALVHDGDKLLSQIGGAGGGQGQDERGDGNDRVAPMQGPAQQGQIKPPNHSHQQALLSLSVFQKEGTEGRHHKNGKEQRGKNGDGHRVGQRGKHLTFHALQGNDRQEGQGDNQFAEDAGLSNFYHRPEDGGPLLAFIRQMAEVPLHILHLDNGGVNDHADGNGQTAQRHQIGMQTGLLHDQKGQQHGQRQVHEHNDRTAYAAQDQEKHHDY
ncbi:MAG: hypothetical protein BWY71_01666 [Planctomycetes bacterium ADurb.Bin412]|nr:MAG: hypothetical protein BWY71_01666 [Planctomycetes bacterium ADurb.Bin412]